MPSPAARRERPAGGGTTVAAALDRAFATGLLERLLDNVVARSGIPGAALALQVGGERFAAAAGARGATGGPPLDASTLFEPIGLTKLIVAAVALRLVRNGRLQLDRPVCAYLPELRRGDAADAISIRHLMSHTSGYLGENPMDLDLAVRYPWSDFVAFFRGTPMLHPPGTVHNVVDSETVILDRVVRRVGGADPLALARVWFVEPLGWERPWHADRADRTATDGHVVGPHSGRVQRAEPVGLCAFWRRSLCAPPMTVAEMADLAKTLVLGGDATPDPTDQVVRMPHGLQGTRAEELPASFGHGCAEYAEGVFGVSGAGFGQCNAVRVVPAQDVALAVALNAQVPYLRDLLVRKALRAFGAGDGATSVPRIELDCEVAELEGTYRAAEHATLEAAVDGDRLVLRRGYNPWVPQEVGAWEASVRIDAGRGLSLGDDGQGLAIKVFRDGGGTPCVMLGRSTFRKAG